MSFNPLINEVFEDYDGINIVDITLRCNKFNLSSSIKTEDNNTFYGMCLNGNDRVSSMSYSQPSSSKEALIQEILNVVSAYFRPSLDITYFFSSDIYNTFVILKKEQRASSSTRSTVLTPMAISFFHYNPTVGIVIPILIVVQSFQNSGLGKTCLALLQQLTYEKLGDPRMMVWLSFTSDDSNEGQGLYMYYRKMGFHLMVPSNYPIPYLFRQKLSQLLLKSQRKCKDQKTVQEYHNSSSSGSKTDSDSDEEESSDTSQFNFLLGTNDILKVDPRLQEKFYKIDKEGYAIRDDLVCEVCGSERLSSGMKSKTLAKNDWFICCRHECDKSNCQLFDSSKQTSKQICGSVMCFTCHNQFGFPETSECPVHLCTQKFPEVGTHNKTLIKLSLKNMTTQLSEDVTRERYFSPATEDFMSINLRHQSGSQEEPCKHCYISNKYGFYINNHSTSTTTATTVSTNILNKFCSYRSNKVDISNLNNINDVKYFGDMKKSFQSNHCFIHKDNQHSPFFNANSGSPSSCLQNSVFGIKFVDGIGDCGPIAIKIAIESAEEKVKIKIMEKIFLYVRDQFQFYKKNGLDSVATKALGEMKKYLGLTNKQGIKIQDYQGIKNKHNKLPLMMIRDALFLSKIDLQFLSEQQEKTFILSSFDELGRFIEEETNINKKHANLQDLELALLDHDVSSKKLSPTLLQLYKEHLSNWLTAFRKNSSNNKTSYYLTTDDLVRIPKITGGLLGILMASENHKIEADHNSCSISDFGYNQYYGENIFGVCSNFALFRNLDASHYEVFYSKLSRRAIFPILKKKKQSLEQAKYVPCQTVLSLLHPQMHFQVTGVENVALETKALHPFLMEIDDIAKMCTYQGNFPTLEKTKVFIENWIDKVQRDKENVSDLFHVTNELVPWLEDMKLFLEDADLYDFSPTTKEGRKNTKKYLVKMNIEEYFPIHLNSETLLTNQSDNKMDDPQESLLIIGYIRKKELKKSTYVYVFCDCNKTEYNQTFNNKFISKLFKNLYANSKSKYNFALKEVEKGLKDNYWSFGSSLIFKNILRNVIHNLLQLKHAGAGPFMNKIFRAANIKPDMWHLSFNNNMIKIFKYMSLRTTENIKKYDYFILYILFSYEDKQLYRHLFIHGDRHFLYLLDLVKKKYHKQMRLSLIARNKDDLKQVIVHSFKNVYDNEPGREEFIKKSASRIHDFMMSDLQVFDKYKGGPINLLIKTDDSKSKDISSVKSSELDGFQNLLHFEGQKFSQPTEAKLEISKSTQLKNLSPDDSTHTPPSLPTITSSTELITQTNMKQLGDRNWYNYIRWFEVNDFEDLKKKVAQDWFTRKDWV